MLVALREDVYDHLAVCVRNMFEEERGGSPGFLEVTVAAPGASSLFDRTIDAVRAFFRR